MNIKDFKMTPLQETLISEVIIKKTQRIGIMAGWGSSKSSGLCMMFIAYAEVNPGAKMLLVLDTAKRITETWDVEFKSWIGPEWTHSPSKNLYTHSNGATLLCKYYFRPGTRDSSANSLEGGSYHLVALDEGQTFSNPEVMIKLSARARAGDNPQLVACGLPVWGAFWMEVTKKAGGKCFTFSSYANTNLPQSYFDNLKATLTEEEYLAMVMAVPQPPTGSVYPQFKPKTYPEGNLAPKGWKYDKGMMTYIAMDFGRREPAAVIFAYDQTLDAHIAVHDFVFKEVSVSQMAEAITKVAWPRRLNDCPASIKYLLDDGVGDKAGRVKNDQTLKSTFSVLGQHPSKGGIGLQLRSTTDSSKTNIVNGVKLMQILYEKNKILMTQELWDNGLNIDGSYAKCIVGYRYKKPGDIKPFKDDIHDHKNDLARYLSVTFLWHYFVNPTGHIPKVLTANKRQSPPKTFKVGGFFSA